MFRRTFAAIATAAMLTVAGTGFGTAPAEAKTHVYVGIGVAPPYWGWDYYPAPYWGYYYAPPVYYYAPRYYYYGPRYRTRCWKVKRWRRVWNGRRWVKKRVWIRKCRRVRIR